MHRPGRLTLWLLATCLVVSALPKALHSRRPSASNAFHRLGSFLQSKAHNHEPTGDKNGEGDEIAEMRKLGAEAEAEDHKRKGAAEVVDSQRKQEIADDMTSRIEKMREGAKRMQEDAKQHAGEVKSAAVDTSVATASIPKDQAGNIIITNQTHDYPRKPQDQVDPMKALKTATENLYQRARHKNLPVTEPGELNTPEQIYQALNRLEYIVDGYRHAQLESPNPDLNITDEPAKSPYAEDDESANAEDGAAAEESAADDARFMQTTGRTAHTSHDDYEDEDDEGDGDHEDGEDDDSEKNGEEWQDNEDDEEGDSNDKKSDAKEKKMSPEEALDTLGKTIADLVETLNAVVASHTGVSNVLIQHSPNKHHES
ncbi:methyl-accepting chemotaxis sensory transducer, putative [Babesia ovata]|uniref:Methyl-accepting chemotaxis sensory transducer, putative n=1 Tax=Babesia ovata TaxID=189622 RepID=A0A2H6KGL0_9APIC|nr:methyl-accepting chemotaxis sensory transducer, putative [Babesia ovata]GBE62140.1 methyl-accepting chemotaxis sensory transducer, putative [Babesia ovata]